VAYSALEPELFCKLLFRKDGDPYLPGTTAQAQAVRLGRRPLVCLGVTSELTKGSSNGNGRSPFVASIRCFAGDALPQIGQRVFSVG
jgi:hypothetical protein